MAARKKRRSPPALGDDPLSWINAADKAVVPAAATRAAAADVTADAVAPAVVVSPLQQGGGRVLDAIVTIGEAGRLREKLLARLGDAVVEVDAGAVEHIDTAGMQLLLAFARSLQRRGGRLVWSGRSRTMVEVAALLGLNGALGLDA